METYFNAYFKSLQSISLEEITEHTHRTALEILLKAIAQHYEHRLQIIHEPKRQQGFGAPDFKISNAGSIVGYVENKKLDENLSKLFNSNQIKKYKELNDNILLTNYKEFVWIKDDEVISKTLFTDWDLLNRNTTLNEKNIHEVEELILKFYSQPPVKIATAKKLAEALAVRAKYLKDFLFEELTEQHNNSKQDKLIGLYETFKTYVFHELTIEEFADAFAQNLAYGLFLAKLNAKAQQVTLLNAKEYIPHSFELIRELVDFLDELKSKQYAPTRWIVEEALTIMNNFDQQEIQRSLFYRRTKTKDIFDETNYSVTDPFIYFYEHFLAAYDKALRKAKGVYYTPPPIVNFIVRAIDDILKSTFNIKDGLADMNKVTVLDFATGTGTFLVDIMQRIIDNTLPKTAERRLLVKEHILKNLYGFEYLIAPYTIAHLKLSQYLKDAGYPLENGERLQVYLTNTLEPADKQTRIPLLPALSEETNRAQEVKEKKILVITGNPPYAINSKNTGEWINELIKTYYYVDGVKINERNPKALKDDYVKFIRFAQSKMENVDEGIVGVITNHKFIINPTFPGMRQSLMKTFNHIYIVDLHGGHKPKEYTPEGKEDENVFDIEQGVAISIFVKRKDLDKKIFVTDFYGTRKEKYKRAWEDSLNDIKFENIQPQAPNFLFRKQETSTLEHYKSFKSLNDIFIVNSSGIKTHRDEIVYGFSKKEVFNRIENIKSKKNSLEKIKNEYKIKNDLSWINEKRALLDKINSIEKQIQLCQYRPFDYRELFYSDVLIDRPRTDIMKNFFHQNIGLISGRAGQAVSETRWDLVFITSIISDVNLFSRGGAVVYPLFVDERQPNFKNSFKTFIQDLFKAELNEKQILSYIYAILHSPTYRAKYAEFLKIDFPRIPFTEDKNLFEQLSELGWQLIQAHLMNTDALNNMQEKVHCTDNGNLEVEKPVFNNEKLFFNKQEYFYPVTKEVYEFHIGGYQVLDKYLKDRKGRKLGLLEIKHVTNIIKVLGFTIEQMKRIDELTTNWI
jgi:hypothetical protein